jgi:antitoxin YefM
MKGDIMDSVSVNKFRDNLKSFVEQIIGNHEPLKVTRRSGEDFVVISADDWAREQETLYVLQNSDLMKQISASLDTHNGKNGYQPSKDELSEITGI